MSDELTRRKVLAGAATVAAAAAIPLPAIAVPAVVERPAVQWLWPTNTMAERVASTVRCMIGHIAEKRGIAEKDVTTEDIHDITFRFGHSFDEVVDAQRLIEEQDANPQKYRKPWRPARPEWLEKLIWNAVAHQPYREEIEVSLARALGRSPTEDEVDYGRWVAAWFD